MAYSTPRTWVAGEIVTAAQLNQDVRDNQLAAFPLGVGAWTSFTPTLTQSATVTKTVTSATYMRVGRTIFVEYRLTVTGTGTAANAVLVGLPVTARGGTGTIAGSGSIYDSSANLSYKGLAEFASTSTVRFLPTETTVANFLGVTSFTAALASGDVVAGFLIYEAAS